MVLKSFNKENDILFIANEGIFSEKILIYNVQKDENDLVARNPIHENQDLYNKFSCIDYPRREININRYIKKEKDKKRI